ncbi:major outer membrane protein [Campylobacter sp. JMF_01 NE2]|uniref:OprD family outer membrane porin n=1 Tax=unclassified Campylobacter TaxID=2593542 RepID=UPI0022EA0C3A|nr:MULTISPECIES: OprD family outer membrane porin [unclassified Campylobacter]MDA3053457.1 major outer membrane protein [Campylobacter sp. JMF_03 NE3]MDA3067805.1 major outer membrane protein [Campylobacter sp. JMF_01 NE2]
MKLFKLSLAAALAAGAFATSASAVALEDAIKDVDVSGFAWMRIDSTKTDDGLKTENDHRWRFKSVVNTNVKIDDNFFFVAGIRYAHDNDWAEGRTADAVTTKFDLYQGYLGYKIGGTTFQLGRQKLGTFFTDDMFGDGLKVVNQDIEGLTLAALYMDTLESDGDIDLNTAAATLAADGKRLDQHDLWGVAAIGSYDPVSFQLWYAGLEDVVDLFAVEAGLSFDVTEDINLGLTAQYAYSNFSDEYVAIGADDADFFGVEASTSLFGFDLTAGYVQYDTDSQVHSRVSFEDQGSFISPGEDLLNYRDFTGDNHAWFITAAYAIADTGLTIGDDFVSGEFNDEDAWENVVRVNYKYNKKLSFTTFWSHVKWDGKNGVKDAEEDHIRFQARYAF